MQPHDTTDDTSSEIEYGYCQCGCGQLAPIAPYTTRRLGWIKGRPIRYINGHYSRPAEERFWEKVDKSGDCWVWTGYIQRKGYGVFTINGKLIRAHRFAWELENGKIPDGMVIMHVCDNRRCVRASHLALGTQLENIKDRGEKERQVRGTRNQRAKLTEDDVAEIRRKSTCEHVTIKDIATEYGVHRSTIECIVQRKTWRHIP